MGMINSGKYLICCSTAIVAAVAVPTPVMAQQATHSFDIPAQNLADALAQFGRVTKRQLIFDGGEARKVRSRAINGRFTAKEGLSRILEGSGFAARDGQSNVFIIETTRIPAQADVPGRQIATQTTAVQESEGADIVVTATRRAESLLNVPISVEAYDQKALDTIGVRNIDDLTRVTPGVSIRTGFSGVKHIAIRGLESTVGATMTGVYIDETPIQVRSLILVTNFYPAIFDLERIEVLRGPQGTLFGAGAMGGAVRFITAKPGLTEYTGSARAELAFTEGGDPSYEAGLGVGGPIIEDVLGFRVSGYHRRDGGYIDRIPYVADRGTSEENSNSRETTAINAALTFAPTPQLTITPSFFYQKVDRNDTDQFWTFRPNPTTVRPKLPYFTNGEGVASYGRDEALIYALKAEYDLGGVSLISNSALIDRKMNSRDDSTATYSELFGGLGLASGLPRGTFDTSFSGAEVSSINLWMTQKQFTQELRIQSNGGGDSRLNYVFGLFYQNSRQTTYDEDIAPRFDEWMLGLTGQSTIDIFGLPTGPGGLIYVQEARSRDRQYAAFGDVSYNLSGTLRLSAGVRVSRMKFDFYDLLGGTSVGPTLTTSGSTSETAVTPKFIAEYKPAPDWMVYASAAKGFRPGGANPLANTTSCAADLASLGISQINAQYKSDSVWSYEVGVKGRAGRAITVAASAFNIDWSGIQRRRILPGCAHVFLDNLGIARNRGFDAKIVLMPVAGLSFDAGIGFVDATLRETIRTEPSAPVQGTFVRKGDRIAAPWTVTLAADYEAPFGSGALRGYGHIQYDFRSSFSDNKDNLGVRPDIARFDDQHFVAARVGVRSGPLDASLFVNNLFNSRDVIGQTQWTTASDRVLRQTFRPRTFGATVGYRF